DVFRPFLLECEAVNFQNFIVPKEIKAGGNTTLVCDVDPWPGPLYSISWWKDGVQFYRVAVTKSLPEKQSTLGSSSHLRFARLFPLDGVTLKAGSRLGEVILDKVEAVASGTYTCEAVADFPSFSQNLISANLSVIEPPATRPILSGFKGHYHPGEILTANCTVLRSHPAPVVSWFVNHHMVRGKVLEVTRNDDHLFTLVSRLTLRLKENHFHDKLLNLTCDSRIGEALWSSNSIQASYSPVLKMNHVENQERWHLPSTMDDYMENALEGNLIPYQRLHSGGLPVYAAPWRLFWIILPVILIWFYELL
ncbi:hypothetical protein SK128_020351, partial [Halocaridina rubra]